MKTVPHFIAGRAVAASGRLPVFNPATGEVTAQTPIAGKDEIEAAVRAARAAQPAWAAVPALKRARILRRFLHICEERAEALVAVITAEHGKTLEDARGEVTRGLEVVEFAIGAPHLLKGEYSRGVGPAMDSWSQREPVGVVLGITPFNFPAMVPLWMFPLALACGNSFLLKPSERVPSAVLLLAEWLTEAGLPDGLFSVLHGDRTTVEALLARPEIDAVSFVGSTPAARAVQAAAIASNKRVQALGGAKNHALVMPDADMEATAGALVGAAYGAAGERCMAISVAVAVGEGTAESLVRTLAPRVESLKIGPGDRPGIDMGPLITPAHRDRVVSYIEAGIGEGATLVVDGREQAPRENSGGFFLGGTLFDHVAPSMSIYREEIFGPVLCIVRASSFEAAVGLVNANPYANGTAIFTRDGATAQHFAARVEVGMVGVNVAIPVPMAFHSFGGWRASMFGDHAIHGPEGVRFYTRLKTVTARWDAGGPRDGGFAMPSSR
jgi:malonate-semialdehyde dehydrogenase (acetylating)/methylmalonate-semialdehyde dehydrogenase